MVKYFIMSFSRFCIGILFLIAVVKAGYDPFIAKQLVYMSSIAYDSMTNINAWNCSQCSEFPIDKPLAFQDSTGQLQAFTGYSPTLGIILAFRGSDDIDNWITDIDAIFTTYSRCSGCQVHAGFWSSWLALKNTSISQITALLQAYGPSPLYVTGHSLGAAIAVLSTQDLKDTFGVVDLVLTFGEPRVGNPQYAHYFSNITQSYRVVHYADIVPHNPWEQQGFFHQGIEIWYNEAMTEFTECLTLESVHCSDGLSFYDYSPDDHHISFYVTLPATFYDYLNNAIKAVINPSNSSTASTATQ